MEGHSTKISTAHFTLVLRILIDNIRNVTPALLLLALAVHHFKLSLGSGYALILLPHLTLLDSHLVNQRVLRQIGRLNCESIVACSDALVVHQGQLITSVLLLLNLVLKLGYVKHKRIYLS